MPLFFMISGYLFNEEKWFTEGFRSFTKNRWASYINIYFIWAIVNLLLNFPIELYDNNWSISDTVYSAFEHIWWILISYGGYKEYPNCTPLWFLPCLFISSIYLYCLVKVERKWGLKYSIFMSMLMLLANYFLRQNNSFILPWHMDVALSASFIMYIGHLMNKKSILVKSITPIIIIFSFFVGTATIMVNEKIDMNMNCLGSPLLFYVGAISISFVLLFLFYNIKVLNWTNLIISRIGGGRNTITILALNYFFNTIFRRTIGSYLPNSLFWIVDVLFVMVASYLVIISIEKMKIRQVI